MFEQKQKSTVLIVINFFVNSFTIIFARKKYVNAKFSFKYQDKSQ